MGFSERIKKAERFENQVLTYFQRKNVYSVKNGTEHTHPEFVEYIRQLSDNGSKFVRFAPDGVAIRKNRTIHWEAKNGKSIEMDAYNTYMKYYESGCIVIVFVKKDDVYWQYVEKIKLYVPEKYKDKVNVDGWVDPRLHNMNIPNGSGTPFKYIDFTSLEKVVDFYELIGQ
jgi:hypothetical protein